MNQRTGTDEEGSVEREAKAGCRTPGHGATMKSDVPLGFGTPTVRTGIAYGRASQLRTQRTKGRAKNIPGRAWICSGTRPPPVQ